MNVGIIVYSCTGNTMSVAQKLEQALRDRGHEASIVRVEPTHNDPRASGPIKLKTAPAVSSYDAVIFASPVHAFSLAPVMKLYLSQVSSLAGKKVSCFVTQHLKQSWLGGNRAIRQIKAACKEKGGDIMASGIVNWSGRLRNQQIDDIVSRLSAF